MMPCAYYVLLDNKLTADSLDGVAKFIDDLKARGQNHRQVIIINAKDYQKLSDEEKRRAAI